MKKFKILENKPNKTNFLNLPITHELFVPTTTCTWKSKTRVASNEFKSTSYEFKSKNYEFKSMSYDFKLLQVTRLKARLETTIPRVR